MMLLSIFSLFSPADISQLRQDAADFHYQFSPITFASPFSRRR